MKIIDIRNTQMMGWVIDILLPKAILPISVPLNYQVMYYSGWVCNSFRAEIKSLFEIRLAEMYNTNFQ